MLPFSVAYHPFSLSYISSISDLSLSLVDLSDILPMVSIPLGQFESLGRVLATPGNIFGGSLPGLFSRDALEAVHCR